MKNEQFPLLSDRHFATLCTAHARCVMPNGCPLLRLCCYEYAREIMSKSIRVWELSGFEVVVVFIYGTKAMRALHRGCIIVPFRNNRRVSLPRALQVYGYTSFPIYFRFVYAGCSVNQQRRTNPIAWCVCIDLFPIFLFLCLLCESFVSFGVSQKLMFRILCINYEWNGCCAKTHRGCIFAMCFSEWILHALLVG